MLLFIEVFLQRMQQQKKQASARLLCKPITFCGTHKGLFWATVGAQNRIDCGPFCFNKAVLKPISCTWCVRRELAAEVGGCKAELSRLTCVKPAFKHLVIVSLVLLNQRRRHDGNAREQRLHTRPNLLSLQQAQYEAGRLVSVCEHETCRPTPGYQMSKSNQQEVE